MILIFTICIFLILVINSSIHIQAPFKRVERIDLHFEAIGTFSQVKTKFSLDYGKLQDNNKFAIEFWFEPFIYNENSFGIKMITPIFMYNYTLFQISYSLKQTTWKIGYVFQTHITNKAKGQILWQSLSSGSSSESGYQSTIR